jgi:hypothetical protein
MRAAYLVALLALFAAVLSAPAIRHFEPEAPQPSAVPEAVSVTTADPRGPDGKLGTADDFATTAGADGIVGTADDVAAAGKDGVAGTSDDVPVARDMYDTEAASAAAAGETTTKNADGTTAVTKSDGTTVTTSADGVVVTKSPDSSTVTKNDDGAITTTTDASASAEPSMEPDEVVEKGASNKTGKIVGGILGGLIGLAALAIIIAYCLMGGKGSAESKNVTIKNLGGGGTPEAHPASIHDSVNVVDPVV